MEKSDDPAEMERIRCRLRNFTRKPSRYKQVYLGQVDEFVLFDKPGRYGSVTRSGTVVTVHIQIHGVTSTRRLEIRDVRYADFQRTLNGSIFSCLYESYGIAGDGAVSVWRPSV